MMIHEITEKVGKYKARKRVGRGPGSGRGKTSTRGQKGAKSRSGWSGSLIPGYEGGQKPYYRRIPKRGFSNAVFRKQFVIVNLKAIEERFKAGEQVTPETLVKVGLIHDTRTAVKILGEGALTKKLAFTAAAFTGAARKKIEDAGGSATVVEV